MKSLTQIRTLLILLTSLMLFSCGNGIDDQQKHRVLVIHSWSDAAEDGVIFPDEMRNAFEQEDLDVEIRHMFLDMTRKSQSIFKDKTWALYEDSIKNWKPDIILINDDPFLEKVLVNHVSDSIFQNTRVVFAGINVLHRDSLYRYPLMTGFVDHIDFERNAELVMNLTKYQSIDVELDYTLHDSLLRESIYSSISDTTRFINNKDFIVTSLDSLYLKRHYPGKTVISFISCAEPEKNVIKGTDISGKDILARFYRESKNLSHLQVKRDILSHNIIDRSRKPQFTCIREQFNNPRRVRFLCGYFTSVQTQVRDQVKYAAEILRGEQPKALPIGTHEQGYYMDYKAMKRFSPEMEYDDFKNKFTIINAPLKYEHPMMVSIALLAGAIMVCFIAVAFVTWLYRWKKKGSQELIDELLYEDMVNKLLFTKKSDTVWHLKGDMMYVTEEFASVFQLPSASLTIDQLRGMVDKESLWGLDTLLDYKNQRGKKSIRLHVSPYPGCRYFWIEVLYEATEQSARSGDLYGILMNIDEKIATENKLKEAQRKSSEVALKETFLANISHDLRTPLNAITGFSELLTSDDTDINDEDRALFNDIIGQNTTMILKMIDNVVEKSQIESGDITIVKKRKSVSELIQESYLTNKVIAPDHLKFKMENDDRECYIDIDVTRTKQIINNFLSNAFKFTIEGSVILGWRYIRNIDKVEIYVRDTGVGVSKEKQEHLFDRFYKANENARGTGLGLDICKTIMEKMEGEIGVKSDQGKGSTFFVRIKKCVTTWLILLCSLSGILCSCNNSQEDNTKRNKIVMLHAFDKTAPNYKILNRELNKTLVNEGINADICHVYLGINEGDRKGKNMVTSVFDSLKRISWEPEIIFADGDRTMNDMKDYIDSIDVMGKVPIVIFALHHPDWDFIRDHSNIVTICEEIDYCRNINLVVEMTGINRVDIELDYFGQDSILRADLKKAIARPPYIDNSDFHVFKLGETIENNDYWKDSIIVTTISAESPEMNMAEGWTSDDTKEHNVYTYSWSNPALAIKRDLFGYDIIDKTNRPQFTAVKSGFTEGGGERFLCGYFASYETAASDLGKAGAKLLKGADARSMTGLTHKREYYMNYAAMKVLGYDYSDYKDKFTIIGAPYRLRHPWIYTSLWLINIIIIALIAAITSWLAARWREKGQNALLNNILHKAEIRKLALRGAASHSVKSIEELMDVTSQIHPDYANLATEIELSAERIGEYSHDIFADIDKDGIYSWWQLRFVVMYDKKQKKRIDGILINIDESKKYEEDLRIANKLAEEAHQKEDFLKTISHEIRTPLNAVVGFSDILASDQWKDLSAEEAEYFKQTIRENNEKLKSMIEDVLLFSRVESGSINFTIEEVNISEVIDNIGSEFAGKIPQGVQFVINNYMKNVYIKTDRMRLRYILDQLMNNAIKFTQQGSIMLGYTYDFDNDNVTIIVEDTGCGISKEKQKVAFDMFWKNNKFIPGLGLGLNIAQKLAHGMGADIVLRSKEGYGSVFLITMEGELRK